MNGGCCFQTCSHSHYYFQKWVAHASMPACAHKQSTLLHHRSRPPERTLGLCTPWVPPPLKADLLAGGRRTHHSWLRQPCPVFTLARLVASLPSNDALLVRRNRPTGNRKVEVAEGPEMESCQYCVHPCIFVHRLSSCELPMKVCALGPRRKQASVNLVWVIVCQEEAKKADEMMNDMRQKLKTMEGTLQKSGLGGHTETAVSDAGLPDFAKGRDVFHRLYKDALRRMQVQAENYLRMLSHTSAAFLKVLDEMAAHPIAAVNEALQIHGPPQLLAPLQVLGYSAEVEPEAAPPPSPESPHERPRPRKLKTSSSLGRERSEARLGRAKTNPALPRSSSQTLRQTLFPSPGPPMPPGFGGGEDSTPSGWAASPDRMDVRPGTGHRRGFPQLATPTNSKERRPSSSGSCRGPSRSPFGVFSMARTGSEGAAEARANKTNGAGPAPRAPEKRAFLHDR